MLRSDESARARLALTGPDRARFLHGMVTCDVEKLVTGQGSRAAMLSVKGRLLATLTVYAREDELLLSMDGELGEKVRQLLDKHIVMDDVEVVDRPELGEVAVYGDDAAAIIAPILGLDAQRLADLPAYAHLQTGEILVAKDPSLGGLGLRLFGPKDALARIPGDALSDEERERRRIEAGTARYGVDLDEERLVVEANLEDAISFDKGCYLGQEVVVRATSRGRVNRKLVGLVVSGQGSAAGGKLTAAAQPEAGIITSSVDSPRMGGTIALGYVHRLAQEAGTPLTLEGTDRKAAVVELPFTPEAAQAARGRL